ncbi:MAG: hypothetical protein AAGK04_02015, partial [Planctomycetota bacterium]
TRVESQIAADAEPGTPTEHADRLIELYAPLKQRFGERLIVLLDQGGLMAMPGENRYPAEKNDEVSAQLTRLFESGVIDGGELAVYRNHPYYHHTLDDSIARRWWTVVVETGIDNNISSFSSPAFGQQSNPRLCLVRPGLDDFEPNKERKQTGREWIREAARRGWAIAAATRYWDETRDTWAQIEGDG